MFIKFGKERAKQINTEWKTLTEQFIRLNEEIGRNTTSNKILAIKERLKEIQNERTDGLRVRNKTIYIEKDETKSIFDVKQNQQRKKHEGIRELKNKNGKMIKHPMEINEQIYQVYNEIWGKTESIDESEQTQYINRLFKTKQYQEVKNPLIKKCQLNDIIRNLGKNVSPGSDGITNEFYILLREEVIEDLHELYANVYMQECLTPTQQTAMVKLIPKKGDSGLLVNYRPISLLNCDYKILAKCINQKLLEEIKDEISKEQKGAVKNAT